MEVPDEPPCVAGVADEIARLAGAQGLTLATAESLTGGKIACQLAAADSSSEWFAGSVVAYQPRVKHEVLKVPQGPLVSEQCAAAMAEGVAGLLGADLTVAVTGVGGPDHQEGQPPGTVWFGLFFEGETQSELRSFSGAPGRVVDDTTAHALRLLLSRLSG
jgi:nicotinamide-nucleotide amidase